MKKFRTKRGRIIVPVSMAEARRLEFQGLEEVVEDPRVDHDADEDCPYCGTSLCDGRIFADWAPKFHDTLEEQEAYARAYGWPAEGRLCGSKMIGIEYPYNDPRHYDGVSVWLYPCCTTFVDRFTGEVITERFLEEDA